jgi:hypothetical protein
MSAADRSEDMVMRKPKPTTGVAATLAVTLCCLPVAASQAREAMVKERLVEHCASVRNDDTVRGYEPSLREATIQVFKTLFPNARGEPNPSDFVTQAQYRCMDGKVLVCFVGANLPCSKINIAKDNPGANTFCKENPKVEFVPAVATGHDAAYSYKCRDGKAVVDGEAWKLDKRGFAKKIWTALPTH